jgi:hypothetical protein
MIIAFAAGLICRLLVLVWMAGGSNSSNFFDTARIMAAGGNVYVEQIYYNYSPLPGFVVAALLSLGVTWHTAYYLFVMVGDFLAGVFAGGASGRRGKWVFVLIWCNPALSIFAAREAGFDVWAVIPLLAALWLWRWSSSASSASSSSTTLSFGGGRRLSASGDGAKPRSG